MEQGTVDAVHPPHARRFSRRRRWAFGLGLVVLAVLLGLWTERKPIAAGVIDRTLAEARVPARYRIADLGLGRQRLESVVIGDPAAPDLVADWIELGTQIGRGGVKATAVRAGHVRVRGRWRDGRLSFGSVDRLLPASGGGRVTLPAIDLDVADARIRLETPAGTVGVKLAGRGRLDGGFRGRVAAVADRFGVGGCAAEQPTGVWQVATIHDVVGPARILLDGSTQAAGLACAGTAAGYSNASGTAAATLGERLGWSLVQDLAVTGVRHPLVTGATLAGRVALQGVAGGLARGRVALAADTVASRWGTARRLAIAGPLAIDTAGISLGEGAAAVLTGQKLRLATGVLPARSDMGAGTPVAPLFTALARSAVAAGRQFDLAAQVRAGVKSAGPALQVDRARLTAASGAVLSWQGLAALSPGGPAQARGVLAVAGGGVPNLRAEVAATRDTLRVLATVQRYAAGGASLALAPVRLIVGTGGATRVATRAVLSGPLGDGRVEGLTLPIDADWRGGRLRLGAGCTPAGFERLEVSGLVLQPARLTLCPIGAALVTLDGGRLGGGARIAAPVLAGRIGTSPLSVAAAEAEVRLGAPGFRASGVAVRIGDPARQTRLDFATLDGGVAEGEVAGRFTGGGGQIANVPLLLSGGVGTWRLDAGRLTAGADLAVADAAAEARFKPLAARGVTLALAGNRIDAAGALTTKGVRVADVTIAHDLAGGAGHADLAVPGLAFGDALQPEDLTRLTYGVVADVKGTLAGEGHIRWSDAGVASDGAFRTDGLDFAAALGPVTAMAGTIRFTDLLGLETAPDQVATVGAVNPGVPVTDGVMRYRLLPGFRIGVAGARWPFAGGELVLEPTVLDFAEHMRREMTFRVTGVDAGRFLQQFDFKNVDATGTFDGVLPMVFDEAGGRIEAGRLSARAGGGTIAYVGEVTKEDVGFWGNLAFQALKSLKYRDVAIAMNGPLDGEMVTEVRFAGVSQGKGAHSNFLVRRLERLPFVFNVRIKAPFRQLIDSARSFYEPARLIERNLPALLERQNGVQPPASEQVP